MAMLTKERITLGFDAKSKEEAIKAAGDLLVKTGCVLENYVEGMFRVKYLVN